MLLGRVGPVSVVRAKGIARHFGDGHDPARRLRGRRRLGNQVVGQPVVDAVDAQVAQARGLAGGDDVSVLVPPVLRLPANSVGDSHQPARFVLAPAQPADGEAADVEPQVLQKLVYFLAAKRAPVAEDERGEGLRVSVGQAQHLVVRQIGAEDRFRPLGLGEDQVALLHAGAARCS